MPNTQMPRAPRRWIAVAIGVAAGVALLAVGGVVYWKAAFTGAAIPKSRVSVSIGNAKLLVPANLIRSADKRVDGRTGRLDLALTWPELQPLPSNLTSPAAIPSSASIVFIAIEPADAAVDPALRPKELYARFLASEVETGPGTLIRRSFKPSSPYGGEVLEIAPPDGEVFAARCLTGESVETPAARCIWQLRYGEIDVQVRFATPVLENWERLSDHVRQLVQRIYLEP